MPLAHLADVSLNYELTGPQHAPIVVLSNSLGTTLNMWDCQLAAFSQHLRILRYDTRGHGHSGVPPGPYSLATLGNDVLHLLNFLDVPDASICGVSLGGMTALWLGTYAPERVDRLVVANAAARIGTAESWNARIDQVRQNGMRSLVPTILERWYTARFRAAQPAAVAATGNMLETNSAEGYAACCAAIRDMDQAGSIENIAAPTLVIAGSEDPVTPPSELRSLHRAILHAQYVEVHAAHLSNIEASAAFNAAVLPFLTAGGASR